MSKIRVNPEEYDRPVRESAIAHVALALVLDISGSMARGNIRSLNQAVNQLIEQMQADSRLKDIVDLGIFVFGEKNKPVIQQGFRAMSDCTKVNLDASATSTYVADALDEAIDMLRIRCGIYAQGGGSYKPWIVLITDGEFHDDKERLEEVGSKIKRREKENKLQFFGLGVDGYRKEQLQSLTSNPSHVIDVKAANFPEFLSWVGRSFSIISTRQIDEVVSLEPLIFTV